MVVAGELLERTDVESGAEISVTIRIVPYVALRWGNRSDDLGNQATIPVTGNLQSTVTETGQISSLLNPKWLGSIGRRRHAASQLL